MEFNLEPDRKRIASLISQGVASYDQSLPITRLDVVYDLTSMDVPVIQAWLDTEPNGEPGSDSSKKFDMLEEEMPDWAEPCGAAFEGNDVTVRFGGRKMLANDEETLCEAVGLFLVEIVKSIRDQGKLAKLRKAPRCYLGVSTFDGSWSWPEYDDRGTDDLV